MKKLSIIAALQQKDRGIGLENRLLFQISDDMKRFKQLTLGYPIIMGRKTFESIGRPLPGRTNIVITRQEIEIPGTVIAHSLEEALEKAKEIDENIFIIGGGNIYEQALPLTDTLYLTVVEGNLPADTFFPDYSAFTKVISEEKHVDEKTGLPYSFLTLGK